MKNVMNNEKLMNNLDDFFAGKVNVKPKFLTQSNGEDNGLYKVDLSKADARKGWRSVIRFLPNISENGVGDSSITKISHYVKMSTPELSGAFDSPRNFNPKAQCPLSNLYRTLTNSNNIVLKEKANALQYSVKDYSYVLILEDEQQPHLVGKIMIFQYGPQIKDKIIAESKGEITGEECDVFDLANGKDFVLIAKEIKSDKTDKVYPDYKTSSFKPNSSPVKLFKDGVFKTIPVVEADVNGVTKNIPDPAIVPALKNFLLKRDHDISDFAPKVLTEEQHAKINDIIAVLTGQKTAGYTSQNSSSATAEDFRMDDELSSDSGLESGDLSGGDDDDDFFANL